MSSVLKLWLVLIFRQTNQPVGGFISSCQQLICQSWIFLPSSYHHKSWLNTQTINKSDMGLTAVFSTFVVSSGILKLKNKLRIYVLFVHPWQFDFGFRSSPPSILRRQHSQKVSSLSPPFSSYIMWCRQLQLASVHKNVPRLAASEISWCKHHSSEQLINFSA